jgi:hypothetical protein
MTFLSPRIKVNVATRFEVIIRGIIEHLYGVRLGQRTVVKLNLHIDDVRDAAPH